MKFKDNLKYALLTYPGIFPNALKVFEHLFIVIGNGYEWKDGELVEVCGAEFCTNVEDAVVNNIKFHLMESNNGILVNKKMDVSTFNNRVKRVLKDCIIPIFHVDERMEDFTVPDYNERTDSNFSFYPISKYSYIYDIPDDVQPDWLAAIMKMIEILDANPDKARDPENILPKAKERIKELYDKLHNTVTWYGDDRWEILETHTREVAAGCHSLDIDVYKCRNLSTGEVREFEETAVERLI